MKTRGVFFSGLSNRSGKAELGLRPGLGTWITLLILGILLPMSILAGISTRQAVDSTRTLAQTRLADLSRALATVIDNHLKAQLIALETFALSSELGKERPQWDTAVLDRIARQMAERLGAAVAVFEPDGGQIVNTLMPLGANLPKTALGGMVQEVVERRQPVISDVTRSSVTGRLGFGVGVPVLHGERVVAVLATLSNTSRLHDILAAQKLPDGIFASLVDRKAVIVARSDERHADFAGRRIVDENARRLAEGEAGRFAGYALEGIWREFAFTRLQIATGWSLVVAQTIEDLNADAEQYASRLVLIGIFVVMISGTLAMLITRLIVQPIAALDRYAATLGTVVDDHRPELRPPLVAQVARLQDNLLAADERLRRQEGRLREFLTLLDLAIFMARRPDGTIIYWSQGAEEFYGYTREEAVGEISHMLLKTQFSIPLAEIEAILREEGQWRGSLTHFSRDGRQLDMVAEMTMAPGENGTRLILEILHDVSELHRTQRALQLALDTGEIGTFFMDLRLADITLDARSAKLLDISSLRLSREQFLDLIPRDQRGAFDAAVARCIGPRGNGLFDAEIGIRSPEGVRVVISMRGQADYSNDLPISIAGVMMDVTRLRADPLERGSA